MTENIVWHNSSVTHEQREKQKKQKSAVLWFTGLSGSGKSTIANAVEALLYNKGFHSYILDGDNVRHGLNKDLTFTDQDRVENIRRIGEVSKLFVDAGLLVLTAFISPFKNDRELVKNLLPEGRFIEVFIDTPIDICESRDPKGLYKKARAGEIKNFTGINSTYEAPVNPNIHIKTNEITVDDAATVIVRYLSENGFLFD